MRISSLIYGVASANSILVSLFFLRLSHLSPEELNISPHIDFGFWADYAFWVFLSAACAYLHRIRGDFRNEMSHLFKANDHLGPRLATAIFCDVIPTAALVTLFIRSLYWVTCGGGPG